MKKEYIFNEAGKSDLDSFPIGNGDIGAMVWGNDKRKASIVISKTDAFSSALRLLKIGRVDIQINDGSYKFVNQKLDIWNGYTSIEFSNGKNTAQIDMWVDANNPCIRIRITADKKINITADVEIWRNVDEHIEGGFSNRTPVYGDFFGQDNDKEPIIVYKDKISDDYPDSVIWYHRNPDSHYIPSLEFQDMKDLAHLYTDPLKNRTFGACIISRQMEKTSRLSMKSSEEKNIHEICIGIMTRITEDEEGYCKELHELTDSCSEKNYEISFVQHCKYWNDFNENSYINLSGDKAADVTDSGYGVQRYMNACGGRGEFPIKFNGSIFVPNILAGEEDLGPDFRRWGGGYWFQNTRLIYWSMLESGDYTLMKPFFEMYEKVFDIASAKVKKHFGFEGVLYPETMSPWATARNLCYSRDRDGLNAGLTGNVFIRYYFSGMLELIVLMIEYVKHTGNIEFEKNVLHKHAEKVISFYKNFYQDIDENGKIIIYPSQALETWQDAKNPMDAVAGLRYIIEELLDMGTSADYLNDEWESFYKTIPELPMFSSGGYSGIYKPSMLKPADEYGKLGNVENPELYAVFPYRLVSFDKDNIDIGIETFRRRALRMNWGWTQDGIQAAVLALPEEAQKFTTDKFSKWNEKCKFQGYWGPNFDWVSDQCHGSSAMIALQKMLMQCSGDKIYLFPAWPAEWDVEFKLHAYNNTVVEGSYKNGKIEYIKTVPENRARDVVLCFNKQRHSMY